MGDSLPDIHRGRRRFLNGRRPLRGACQTVPCVCVVNLITCIHHEAPASFSSGEQSVLQTQDEAIHPGAVVSGKQRGASRATRRLADFTLRRSIVRNPPTKRLVMKIRGDGCLAGGGSLNVLMDGALGRPAPEVGIFKLTRR